MTPIRLASALVICVLFISGCQHDRDHDRDVPPPPPPTVTSQGDSLAPRELDRLIVGITRADTAAEESEALQRFRKYLVDHNLTYRTRITGTTDERVIDRGASTVAGPLRVTVETSQGRQVLRTFTFIPKDNRNLTLLGQ